MAAPRWPTRVPQHERLSDGGRRGGAAHSVALRARDRALRPLLRKGVAQVAAELGVEPMQIQLYKIGGSAYDKQYKARRCSPPAVASPDVGLCKARRWPTQLRHGYSLPQQCA